MSAGDAAPQLEFHYVLSCPCGETLTADSEDEIVETTFAHLRERHPEMADKYDREQVLSVTRRLVRPPR
jgi:predicted small metal-binding protein